LSPALVDVRMPEVAPRLTWISLDPIAT